MGRLLLMLALMVVARKATAIGQHLEQTAGLSSPLGSVSLGADALNGAGGTILIVILTILALILIRKFGALE